MMGTLLADRGRGMGTLILARMAAPFGMWETHSDVPAPDMPAAMTDLYAAWKQAAGPESHPRAVDFVPRALQSMAPNLALVDLRRGVEQGRYLWAGPNLAKLFGSSLTGRLLSQCYRGQALKDVKQAYQRLLSANAPVFSDRRFRVFSEKLGYHRLLLPLLDDHDRVGFAMLMLVPKGQLRAASDWRPLEIELELVEMLRGSG